MSQQHPFDIADYSDGKPQLTEELMLAYLEGRLTAEEIRKVERLLAEEGMDSDAAEGLLDLPTREAQKMVDRLNRNMQRQLKRNSRKRARGNDLWTWVAVIIVLLLIAAGYYLVHLLGKG